MRPRAIVTPAAEARCAWCPCAHRGCIARASCAHRRRARGSR